MGERVHRVCGKIHGRIRAMFLRSHDSDPVHPTRCPMTFALRRGVSASNARTCGSNASKLVVLARRGGYFGGESEASARSTVFFAQPTSLAILRIDKPCPRRYRICAHCSKEITHPTFFGWATFQRALTPHLDSILALGARTIPEKGYTQFDGLPSARILSELHLR